jgi:O-antigen/teichoic acid export membrane protein
LGAFGSVVATFRFVLILTFLMFVSATPLAFFSFQLGSALLEIASLAWMAYRLLPPVPAGQRIGWDFTSLRPVLTFSLSIAFTSSVWVLVTQADKLVLSTILPLGDYGYFTVAVLVASGIVIISRPISGAIMPRMTRLQAEGRHEELIAVYRRSTQLVAVIAVPVTLVLSLFSRQVLWAWTGDSVLVEKVSPVLALYAIGYGVLAVTAFPYYLQYAKGNLRLHLIGNALFMIILIPTVVWAAVHYGMTGAGWAWLLSNVAFLFAWTPLVHRRFAPGLHLGWLLKDVARPAFLACVVAGIGDSLITWASTRLTLIVELAAATLVLMSLAYSQASRLRFARV